jgi:hypothetical protein
LDFFGGFGAFQWVTANPNKKIFPPWATLKRASADNFSPSHSVIRAAPVHSRQPKYIAQILYFRNQMRALIALAVVGRRASSTFRFFVMAGLDPAIHENADARNQANDNVT